MHSSVRKKNRHLTDLITSLIIANGQMGGIKSKTTGFPAIFSLPGHAELALPTGPGETTVQGIDADPPPPPRLIEPHLLFLKISSVIL